MHCLNTIRETAAIVFKQIYLCLIFFLSLMKRSRRTLCFHHANKSNSRYHLNTWCTRHDVVHGCFWVKRAGTMACITNVTHFVYCFNELNSIDSQSWFVLNVLSVLNGCNSDTGNEKQSSTRMKSLPSKDNTDVQQVMQDFLNFDLW